MEKKIFIHKNKADRKRALGYKQQKFNEKDTF